MKITLRMDVTDGLWFSGRWALRVAAPEVRTARPLVSGGFGARHGGGGGQAGTSGEDA